MKITNKQIEHELRNVLPFPVTIEGVEHIEAIIKNIGDPDVNYLNDAWNRIEREVIKKAHPKIGF